MAKQYTNFYSPDPKQARAMSLLQEQAERIGWIFQANQNLHMAEKHAR